MPLTSIVFLVITTAIVFFNLGYVTKKYINRGGLIKNLTDINNPGIKNFVDHVYSK